MRLHEIYENQDELSFQMALQNKLTLIPPQYRSEVSRLALRHMSRGESPSDAFANAWDATKEKYSVEEPDSPSRKRPQEPMHKRKEQEPKLSKSGKKWGNQYYSNPSDSGGVSGAIAKNRPTAIAKRAKDAASNYVGGKMDIGNQFKSKTNTKTRR